MNKLYVLCLIIGITHNSQSQKIATTYHDSLWYLTSKDFAKYYRIGVIDTINYKYFGEVKDYYRTGIIQMKGNFQANVKTDSFYFYYPNGNLMYKGLYHNNLRYGIWTYYHPEGGIKDKVLFNGDFICTLEHYGSDGDPIMINGTGKWERQYYNELFHKIVNLKGEYLDTLRHGKWTYNIVQLRPGTKKVMSPERLECIEEYDLGRFVSGKYYWGGGAIQDISSPKMNILPESVKFERLEKWLSSKYASIESYPFLKFLPKLDSSQLPVDQIAKLPDGFESLDTFFQNEMKLSKSYINSQKLRSFTVIIAINKTGDLEVIDEPGKKLMRKHPEGKKFYSESMRVLNMLPHWEPAIRSNIKALNYFSLSVYMDNGIISTQLISLNEVTGQNAP